MLSIAKLIQHQQ